MNVIILCGGYGTRLQREVAQDIDVYGHLLDVPKPLLPIGGVPLITRWIEILKNIKEIKQVFISTNGKYHDEFVQWSRPFGDFVSLVCDGTTNNDDRLGSNGTIEFVLKKQNITDEDVLVIAGDTLLTDDFDLDDFLGKFHQLKHGSLKEVALVTSYTCKEEETIKHGILEINKENLVINFMEKPKPTETRSRQACPCFYAMSGSSLHNVSDFLMSKQNEAIECKDATGHFIKYLIERVEVHSYRISSRFDVGGLESYIKCNQYFT